MEQKRLTVRPTQGANKLRFCLASSELDFLQDLMKDCGPGKILAVDVNEEICVSVRNAVEEMDTSCQVEYCDFYSLLDCLKKAGDEIDFLVLNSICNMPLELLDFIAVLPYLRQDAVVVLHDAVLSAPAGEQLYASSILFQTVTAEKYTHNRDYYLDFIARMALGTCAAAYPQCSSIYRSARIQFPILSAFRVNEDTRKYIRDLFAALRIAWPFIPDTDYLGAYGKEIAGHYSPEILQLYQQSVKTAERFFDTAQVILESMTGSLFRTFPYILLYGKGKWGHTFLRLSKKIGIQVTGFIVSDDRPAGECEGLPVYPFSQIPFEENETLIIQTANSSAIEATLRESKWHWIGFPESFWARRGGLS